MRSKPLVLIAIIVMTAILHTNLLSAQVLVVGGLTREATVQPGGKTEGKIILRNTSDKPQEVRLYQTDYLFWADGRTDYGEPGKSPRTNARWIGYTPKQLTLAPNGTDSIYYTIEVPKEDNLSGTYWSMLMVEPISGETIEPPKTKDRPSIGIRTVSRYAIQIVTHIGDTGKRDIKFLDKTVLIEEGKKTLQIDIENTGERWLIPLVWAELYDEKGVSIGRFDGGRLRIYPGCSVRYRIDLSNVPEGKYKAIIVADNGDEYIFGAQYDLKL